MLGRFMLPSLCHCCCAPDVCQVFLAAVVVKVVGMTIQMSLSLKSYK